MSAVETVDRGRSPAESAQLALLLEVAGTPKPGNVDRHRDLESLRFEHFLAGAIGSGAGLRAAQQGASVGDAFETAVAGMSTQDGGNTQFGCLLLLVPLVATAASGPLTPARARNTVESTTVEDAVAFYQSFEHVDVAVRDPPPDLDALDVRRGAGAAEAIRDREMTLEDIMKLSAEPSPSRPADGNAREWTTGFERSFRAADRLLADEGPVGDRIARTFLRLLAEEPDTLVATNHGTETARDVCDRAAAIGLDLDAAAQLAETFVDDGINPGTTADLTAAAAFIALERGLTV